MKRMVLIAGIALSVISCAQHNSNAPDTSGVDPQNPNQTVPGGTANDSATNMGTINAPMPGGVGGNNMNNDGTNNNQTVNTGDSATDRSRNNQ